MYRYLLLGALALLAVLAGLYVVRFYSTSPYLPGYTFVKSLKSYDGKHLGNIYVKYGVESAFTDLRVLDDQGVVLYSVTQDGFFYGNGKRNISSVNSKSGFRFLSNSESDSFTVEMVNEKGQGISDPATIQWNYYDSIFEVNQMSGIDLYESCSGLKVGMTREVVENLFVPFLDDEKFHTSQLGSLPDRSVYIIDDLTGSGCGYHIKNNIVTEIEHRIGRANRYYTCIPKNFNNEHSITEFFYAKDEKTCFVIARRPLFENDIVRAEEYSLLKYNSILDTQADEPTRVFNKTFTLDADKEYTEEVQKYWFGEFMFEADLYSQRPIQHY